MKKIIIGLIISISLFSFNESKAEKYNVIAKTNHPYTQNYSISIVVEGYCLSGGSCSVFGTYIYTEYGLSPITFSPVIGSQGWYYVSYNYDNYYFYFG